MNQLTAISSMTTNVNIGINEVVSIFVAKHESELFRQKHDLSERIRVVKRELEELTKKVVDAINTTWYEGNLPHLGLTVSVSKVTAHWEDHYKAKKGNVAVELLATFKCDDQRDTSMNKIVLVPISQVDRDEHDRLTALQEQLNAELLSVMTEIKQISRKERQIRGRIAEMKLEQSGQADLLNHPDLIKLIGA